jgi:hypothetical protein
MALEIHSTPTRHTGRWIFLVILLLILIAAGWFGYKWYTTGVLPPVPLPIASASGNADESDVSADKIGTYTVAALSPRYVRIPALKVTDSRVYPIKLDSNNLFTYPDNIHDAGWYTKSNTPGNGGVIVLNGYSKGSSASGPFADAASLKPDDLIILERGDGMVYSYKVVDVKVQTVDEATSKGTKLLSTSARDGSEALNIIADSGLWVPKLGTFDHRVIVRSVLSN